MNLVQAAVSPAANTLNGEGWRQAAELGVALLLSAAIGLEREIRQKDAGLRTHTLVGLGAALFMLISKYGFTDVLERGLIVLDPSRVAAQIAMMYSFTWPATSTPRTASMSARTSSAVATGLSWSSGDDDPWVSSISSSATAVGYPIESRAVNRSRCASGSG